MNVKIDNLESLKYVSFNQIQIGSIEAKQNGEQKKDSENRILSQQNIYNYQQALQRIMSGDNTTQNIAYSKKNKDDNAVAINFSQFVKNSLINESSDNSNLVQQALINQQSSAKKGDITNLHRNPSFIQFEYLPRKELNGFDNQKITYNQNNQKVVFVNFKMKEFHQDTLNIAINNLVYGTKATLCIPNRKSSNKVILVMSTTSADKLKAINVKNQTDKVIDITKICDIEYGIKNQNHASIRGLDSNRVISFYVNEHEEIECLVQFETQQARDLFLQGFQHFVKQSHKTQLTSGNIFKLKQQIESHILEEQGNQQQQLYDINEILDIFDSKVQLSISRSYLKRIYLSVIKKDLDQQLAQQKITYIFYQKVISDSSGILKPITNKQFLEVIDIMLDRSELYTIFEKASSTTDIKNQNKSENILTIEGFKQFILYNQKEIVSMQEIEQLFKKILSYEKKNYQTIPNDQPDNLLHIQNAENNISPQKEEQKQDDLILEMKKDSISFNGFVRYIYSKNNSIMNPKKEPIYQNMNKPINEYYISSAKNIFHANFDILTMTKIAGFNFGKNEKYFPLLYVLSRGARYIEIEVWDGDTEPVIIYGPIMNTKLNVSEFLTQLIKQAFVINPYPLFLNIVPHCTIKQQFKLKYLIEKILKDNIYMMPADYKERTNLPSPNDLKHKIIIIGKLPHTYDGLIQEQYTHQDVIRFHQQSQINSLASPNPNATFTQDNVIAGGNTTLLPSNSYLNQSYNQTGQNNPTYLLPQTSYLHPYTSNMTNGNQYLQQGQSLNQNRSISMQANTIDGTLLTPVHVFSCNNFINDSIDHEMNEMILQEEMEENVNVFVAAGYLAKISQNNILNSTFPSSSNPPFMESIQSTARRGHPSSVKAIDSFFSKNVEPPKFKKFIQYKYEDVVHPDLMPSRTGMDCINEENSDNHDFNQDDIIEAKRGTYLNMKYHPSEKLNQPGLNIFQKANSQSDGRKIIAANSNSNRESQSGDDIEANKKQQASNINNNNNNNNNSMYPPDAYRQKQESLNNFPLPTLTHGINQSNIVLTSAVFQMHCIRDYAPIIASNTIESLYSLYISKITKKKPALWEVYDFSQRELLQHSENRLGYSVLSSYVSVDAFTKYYIAMIKPSCKPSDSNNINPIPFFNQGFQFILNYFHTFDRNSLIYQSRFHENGGQTCGYILKPFQLRNHVTSVANRHKIKSTITDHNATQLCFNGKIDEQEELNYYGGDDEDNEEMKLMQTQKSLRNFVQIQIVSGFNLTTSFSDKVDSYVEVMIFDGDINSTFKTTCIENNNMNPKWNYDIKFTVQNPSLCFIVFQIVNTHHTNLLGWYSIPFSCIRQGFRVIPLRDGFFNTIKNSFILCEISIVRESQAT